MTESVVARNETSTATDVWIQENDRGLALAADGDWSGAAEAFAAAADALARDLPLRPATHEPLALVLGNLAHATFRDGRMDEAIQQAQRTCALRVAIAGEDGMPVARARMDLAVMLASAGRGEEAMALVQRAIAAIEHRVGDEDVRLAIVLENAARIALALGSPSNAEPLLLRLHGLLHAHDLSTGRADKLLARVAEIRQRQRFTPSRTPVITTATATPRVAETISTDHLRLDDLDVLEMADEDGATSTASATSRPEEHEATAPDAAAVLAPREYAHASIEDGAPWEDQPLRDAVVLTDVLLRTTPASTPIIPVGTPLDPIEPTFGAVTTDEPRLAAASITPVRPTPTATGIPPLDDRGPTIVLPTPDRGVRAMETPSRSSRTVRRQDDGATPARRDEGAAKGDAKGDAKGTARKTAAPSKSGSDAPMLAGLLAAAAAGGGAIWWFLLR